LSANICLRIPSHPSSFPNERGGGVGAIAQGGVEVETEGGGEGKEKGRGEVVLTL
jgi:hypothetical protein